MKNLLFRFFLSLCFLLFGGSSMLHAHMTNGGFNSSINHSNETNLAGFDNVQNGQDFVIKPSSIWSSKKFKLKATNIQEDEEEEEESSIKKNLVRSKYLIFNFCDHTFGSFLSDNNKKFPFYKEPSHTSSCLYIIFQVFRI